MSYDLNKADKQTSFELIPDGTICKVGMKIRPGGHGDGGWLKESKSSDAVMLDCEFIVSEGEFLKRRFWQNFVISGGKLDSNGNSIAGNISRQTLRAIVESARNINPDDMNQTTINKRIVEIEELNGMEFICEVKIESDKTGKYGDSNRIKRIITPDMPEYNFDQSSQSSQSIQSCQSQSNKPSQQPAKSTIPIPAWAK